jgi:hypothetical protein
MAFYRHCIFLFAFTAVAPFAASGCRRDVASTDRRAPGDAFDPSVVLEGPRASEAIDAMRAPAAGVATRPLVVAADGVRFSDAPMAIRNVAGRSTVGITFVQQTDVACLARTVLPDGREGEVCVDRAADGALAVRARLAAAGSPQDEAFARDVLAELRRLGAIKRPQ